MKSTGLTATHHHNKHHTNHHTYNPSSSSSSYYRTSSHPAGLLAQDPSMPLLDQPDAGTTIEEVKRRLIEETDSENREKYDIMMLMQGEGQQKNTQQQEVPPVQPQLSSVGTTLVYKIGNQTALKIRLPHNPLTLGHVKAHLNLQHNDNYRCFVKMYPDKEFRECSNDDSEQVLPSYQGVVRAKFVHITANSTNYNITTNNLNNTSSTTSESF